ncbi:MAG: AraC family transcriptional regulator [Spirochaetes bacterium]|nr:AraC family transcriptional regulator [Spirochaetota bacterium]
MSEFYSHDTSSGELRILFSGHMKCRPSHRYDTLRNHYLMHVVMKGSGTFAPGDAEHELAAGSIFVVFPFQRHWYRASRTTPWEYVWLGFDGPQARTLLSECGIVPGRQVVHGIAASELSRWIADVSTAFRRHAPGASQTALGYFHLIRARITAALSAGGGIPEPSVNRRVADASAYIDEHYYDDLTTADIASHVGLERTYFSKMFVREKGMGLHACLISRRVAVAKRLIAEGELTLAEIAHMVGYRDYASFERMFRRQAGVTPSVYRMRRGNGKRGLERI